MTVSRICQREVDTVLAHETAQAAGQRMGSRCVGSLAVVDDKHHPIGVVTDRDLAVGVTGQGADPTRVTVGELMSAPPVTVDEGTQVEDALRTMQEHSVRRLLVTGFDGRLVGVLSLDDVVRSVCTQLEHIGALLLETSPAQLADP